MQLLSVLALGATLLSHPTHSTPITIPRDMACYQYPPPRGPSRVPFHDAHFHGVEPKLEGHRRVCPPKHTFTPIAPSDKAPRRIISHINNDGKVDDEVVDDDDDEEEKDDEKDVDVYVVYDEKDNEKAKDVQEPAVGNILLPGSTTATTKDKEEARSNVLAAHKNCSDKAADSLKAIYDVFNGTKANNHTETEAEKATKGAALMAFFFALFGGIARDAARANATAAANATATAVADLTSSALYAVMTA